MKVYGGGVLGSRKLDQRKQNSSTFVGFTFCHGTQLHHYKGCDIKHKIRDILKSTRVASELAGE